MATGKTSGTKKTSTAKKSSGSKPKSGSGKSGAKSASQSAPQPIRRELWGVIFLLLSVFTAISYFSTEGSFILFFSNFMKGLIGWGYWLITPAYFLIAMILLFHKGRPVTLRLVSALLLPLIFAAIVHLINYEPVTNFNLKNVSGVLFEQGQSMRSGGLAGGLIAIGLEMAFSIYGAMPVLVIAFIFFLIKSLKINLAEVASKVQEQTAVRYDPSMYDVPLTPSTPASEKRAVTTEAKVSQKIERIPRNVYSADIPLGEDDGALTLLGPGKIGQTDYSSDKVTPRKASVRKKDPLAAGPTAGVKPLSEQDAAKIAGVSIAAGAETAGAKNVPLAVEISDPPKPKKLARAEIDAQTQAVAQEVAANTDKTDYQTPPLDLLFSGSPASTDSRSEIILNKDRLETAIRSFGINAGIVGVIRGPTVTRYDLELDQGVKLSKLTNLAGDLALALGVVNVRIAPIPDKISTVGIEVPNKIVSTVHLRTILESPKFLNAKSKLSFALGKDISGDCIVGNIAKLPHMLIAGTTGSGKSVCMNALIISILYKARPEEVRFIMIDPKMVELGVYNNIPHLFVPVVTDPKKAAGALQWSVVEMLKRYRLFSDAGVRDLESYNKYCDTKGEERLPQIVIVIDELADLMLAASKEVEESICRVAQMGRAAGMHLIIATQRPSADVITGLMKANIPSRIAFAVSSAMESRIILDQSGAEKLVGMGDMLFSPVGCGKPTRIQGAYVTDEERENVIQFIKEGSAASEKNDELEDFMNKALQDKNGADSGPAKDEGPAGDYDEMLPQAAEVVLEMKGCSVSMLQRRLKLGYSRAARIVDQMEELGIVGPYEGAKPRQLVTDRNGWKEIQVQLGLIADDGMALAAELSENGDSGYSYDD